MIEKIVLGSSSPRRREILQMLSLPFEVISPDADENISEQLTPEKYVMTLAERKGSAVSNELLRRRDVNNTLVISCDTIVYFDGKIIGKPKDTEDARRTLRSFSGKEHYVYSGLLLREGDFFVTDFCATRVKFADVSDEEIEKYLQGGEPMGKAGSYAVQERGAALVELIDGDFFNVVGLPVSTLRKMLKNSFDTDIFSLSERLLKNV